MQTWFRNKIAHSLFAGPTIVDMQVSMKERGVQRNLQQDELTRPLQEFWPSVSQAGVGTCETYFPYYFLFNPLRASISLFCFRDNGDSISPYSAA